MKVVLCEMGASHDECLYTQMLFLTQNKSVKVYLYVNKKLKGNLKHFPKSFHIVYLSVPEKSIQRFKFIHSLKKEWADLGVAKVIFNTAQGSLVKRLLLHPFYNKVEYFGILHNVGKLEGSAGQKVISKKLKNYFLLSDYLKSKALKLSNKEFHVFYPVFFPKINEVIVDEDPYETTYVFVPGQVERKRRDYEGLLASISQHGLAQHIKFVLLGKSKHSHGDGKWLEAELVKLGVRDQFIMWDDFIPVDEFFKWIQISHYNLPLIHNDHVSSNLYKNQISGGFNLGFAFKMPFLLPSSLKAQDDWESCSLFYEKPIDVMLLINSLQPINRELFNWPKKLEFDAQAERYLSALGLGC